jgi:hypothetical protein
MLKESSFAYPAFFAVITLCTGLFCLRQNNTRRVKRNFGYRAVGIAVVELRTVVIY